MKSKKFLAITILAIVALVCVFVMMACDNTNTHVCEHKCSDCGKCTNSICQEEACKEKCPVGGNHNDDAPHVCESKCLVCNKCTNPTCQEDVCKDKCQGHGADHVCLHKCPVCQKCLDAACTEDNCKNNQCQGHGDNHVCKHECPLCHKCTDPTCTEAKCKDNQCQGHGDNHVCKHECPICHKCTDPTCNEDNCKNNQCHKHGDAHVCSQVCEICGGCLDDDCDEDNCKPKCQGHKQEELLDYDMSGVSFNNGAATYNGQAQALAVTGELPNGVTVKYEFYVGEATADNKVDAAVNAGTYTVVAKFTGQKDHNPIDDMTATLTVNKATYTPGAFNDKQVTYNGQPQTITVAGEIPTGVTITYEYYRDAIVEGNKLPSAPVNVGEYKIVAKFAVNLDNYKNVPASKTASLEIAKANYDMRGVSMSNATVEYNGKAQTIKVTGELPAGVTVDYEYLLNGNKIDSEPIRAGSYTVVAKFTSNNANYNSILDKTAILTITLPNEKADIVVELGATKNASSEALDKAVKFVQNKDGSFSVYVAGTSGYIVEVLNSNVTNGVDIAFYSRLNDDGTVDVTSDTIDSISNIGDVLYALITLANDEDADYYNDNLVVTIKGEHRVVEIYTYEDLLLMSSDVENYSVEIRKNAIYKLMNDIDCGGAVWKTIGTRTPEGSNEVRPYQESFLSEFDGQGYKVYNYKLTEDSVSSQDTNTELGIALGFFGFLSDAYVHDVTFSNVEIDFSVVRLAEKDAYVWNGDNVIYFGVIAGRVNIDDQYKVGTRFSNINVEHVNTTNLVVSSAYVGTFFGWDSGITPEHYQTSVKPVRENLVADDINITVKQNINMMLSNRASVRIGGYVGGMFTYIPLMYENCSVNDITLVVDRDLTGLANPEQNGYFNGVIGGFVSWYWNATWAKDSFGDEADGFKNCSLTNYTIENRSNNSNNFTSLTCASRSTMNKPNTSVVFIDCTFDNNVNTDKEYEGVVWYQWNSTTQHTKKWVYSLDTNTWVNECMTKCEICGKCTDEACQEPACLIKCQKHGDDHVCLHVCPICDKCYDATCEEIKCSDKCEGHEEEELVEHNLIDVTFADGSATFNGNAQTLAITGTLPDGVTVTYEYYNGEVSEANKLDSAPVNAGTYTVVAKFTYPNWINSIADVTATLTVNKASFDYSESFNDKTVTYNGQEQSITIADLPSGVDVTYVYYNGEVNEANKLSGKPTNAGVYTVVAVFTLDNPNYTAVADNATLTISKVDIEVTFGATKNASNVDLGATVVFHKVDTDVWHAFYATSGTYTSYAVEVLTKNFDVNVKYYTALNADGTVKADTMVDGKLSATTPTLYALITPTADAISFNNPELVVTIQGKTSGTVEIYNYDDLLLMASDAQTLPGEIREKLVYKLMNDIDCGGRVWKTIGTLSAKLSNCEEKAFASELHGQDHTISNFKLTNDSIDVSVDEISSYNGIYSIAFGFFGYVSKAKVHNIGFADINVNIDTSAVGYKWTGNSYADFGLVAGYVGMSWVNDFHDITITRLNATFGTIVGNVGTFFGVDAGRDPNLFKQRTTTERTNLVATDITINAVKKVHLMPPDVGEGYSVGGFVGRLEAMAPVYYKNCSLTNIALAIKSDLSAWGTYPNAHPDRLGQAFSGMIGGFVGYHDTLWWGEPGVSHWTVDESSIVPSKTPMTIDQLHDKFENCTITNYKIENESYTPNKNYTQLYCGREFALANAAGRCRYELQFTGSTIANNSDSATGSGMYHCNWNSAMTIDKYFYDTTDTTWKLQETYPV